MDKKDDSITQHDDNSPVYIVDVAMSNSNSDWLHYFEQQRAKVPEDQLKDLLRNIIELRCM